MFHNVLSSEQLSLLPLVKEFKEEFYLVGGTAVALQIGHRESIDFDLFKNGSYSVNRINKKILQHGKIDRVKFESEDEYTIVINGVQFTFYDYPYDIIPDVKFERIINMPSLLTLGAMKAFALGKRAKWKDYVDLYFILQTCSFADIVRRTQEIYLAQFNQKLFRQQLSYYEDVRYDEEVYYKKGFKVSGVIVKKFLSKIAIS